MIFQAHKGVSTENPENTMPAFIAAAEQGYQHIELDVGVTRDMKFVLLHDDTINRTARLENGEALSDKIYLKDITYSEALQYDFGLWFSEKFRGVKIPLFEDVLKMAAQNGVKLKIDNKYERFTPEQREAFFELIKPYEDIAQLTTGNIDELKTVSELFPKMALHYDGEVTLEKLTQINKFLPKERLTVWLPQQNSNTTWVKIPFADEALAALVKPFASLGIWLLSRNNQFDDAVSLGADVIETNGQLKPESNKGMIADMHTHSENSHDSVCPIEDMYLSERQKGTAVMAVTDHCDSSFSDDYDIFTPIKTAYSTVEKLNEKYGDKTMILAGIEIGESIWYPDEYKKASALCDYDVVIGSVHILKYKELTEPYSKIDFSAIEKSEVEKYLEAYFNDVLTTVDSIDFDILPHLTCPLRYINGKYKRQIDLTAYSEKIEEILKRIIKKGIALEVNTSSFGTLNDFMPSTEILKKYYDMGGYLITLGSDAHIAENASADFEKAIDTLKSIGFRNIYYYKKRKAYQITI